jgi:predicted ABC-type ATPase
MTEEHIAIKAKAEEYAKENKLKIAREKTSKEIYLPETNPVSVFMAGSPGAGKTESSRNLLKKFSDNGNNIIRIDPDELRECFVDYKGSNSSLFHTAATFIVEKIHDLALHNKQSFIFDGTLSNFEKAKTNIQRSLDKKRFVQIYYVYQDPIQAWEFVKKREEVEGRNIPRDRFIEQYFAAHDTVNALKREFGKEIQVDLLVKNIDGSDKSYHANIDNVDNYVVEKYTRETLTDLIQ